MFAKPTKNPNQGSKHKTNSYVKRIWNILVKGTRFFFPLFVALSISCLPFCYGRLEWANRAVDSWGSATYALRGSKKKEKKHTKKTRGAADSSTVRSDRHSILTFWRLFKHFIWKHKINISVERQRLTSNTFYLLFIMHYSLSEAINLICPLPIDPKAVQWSSRWNPRVAL